MSDSRLEMEDIGAVGGAPVERIDQDILFELSLKSKEFGDAKPSSDSVEPLEKRERDLGMALETTNGTGSISNSNKSSKRQRKNKNRRRRRKNAEAQRSVGEVDTTTSQSVDFTKDDLETDGDTMIEKESEANDQASVISTKTSLVMTTIEDIPESTNTSETISHQSSCTDTTILPQLHPSGPTYSVQSLLNIAKERISEGIRSSPREELQDLEFNMVVPPCSPSSVHNIIKKGYDDAAVEYTQIPPRINHFDNNPPEVLLEPLSNAGVTPESIVSAVTKLQDDITQKLIATSDCSSVEAIILGSNSESSVGSLASIQSAVSLLKGDNSCDDVGKSSIYHFPSEDVIADVKEGVTHSNDSISTGCFRETIEVFKLQNPQETSYLEQQVDLILSNSMSKYSSLVDNLDVVTLKNAKLNQMKEETSEFLTLAISSDKQSQTEVMKVMDDLNYVTNVGVAVKVNLPVPKLNCNKHLSEKSLESAIQIETIALVPSKGNFIEDEKEQEAEATNLNSAYVVDVLSQPGAGLVVKGVPLSMTESLTIVETTSAHSTSSSAVVPNTYINKYLEDEQENTSQYASEILSEVQITVNEVVDAVELQCPRVPPVLFGDADDKVNHCQTQDASGLRQESNLIATRAAADVRQSVELFSIYVPSTSSNLPKGSGDQPFLAPLLPLSTIEEANFTRARSIDMSDIESEGDQCRKTHGDGDGTDSDFPWQPECKEKLAKVIEQKEASIRACASPFRQPGADVEVHDDNGEDSGCKCAKMCVIC